MNKLNKIPLFEDFPHNINDEDNAIQNRSKSEDWNLTYNDILRIQDNLSSYVPPFDYDDYVLDYEKSPRNETYNIWIEFIGVNPDFCNQLDNPEFYNRQDEDFKMWMRENGFDFNDISILSTVNSVTYNVELI